MKSQCSSHANDLCQNIPLSQLNSDNGPKYVVNDVHQRDPLFIVSEMYADFNQLLSARQNTNEQLKNFETRFEAVLFPFSGHVERAIPELLLALMLP